jgi:hypothetical protein
VDFPHCLVGQIRRAKIKVVNWTEALSTVHARSDGPFVCPITEFTIDPSSFVLFPIHFVPKEEGAFQGTVMFTTRGNRTTFVDLRGTCAAV